VSRLRLPLINTLVTERYERSPHLPVEDPAQVDEAIDIALRLGVVFLSCGAPTSDVQDAVFAAGAVLGLTGFEVDINFSSISLSVPRQQGSPAQSAIRVVRTWHVNHARLAAAHRIMLDLSSERLDRAEVSARLRVVETTEAGYGRTIVTLAFGVMAAAIVVSLGGNALTSAIAFGSAILVDLAGRFIGARGAPAFFVNAVGALIASMVAVAFTAADADAPSALVVAGGIMALLPGLSLVVASQEAIGRFPVTAGARLIDLIAAAAGIVAGVLIALLIADKLDIAMIAAQRFATDRGIAWVGVIAAGIAASASAASSRSPISMFLPAALAGALGVAVLRGMATVSHSEGAATALAAAAVGVLAEGLARWRRVPPVLIIAPGVIPLLPGLTLYRGLLEYSQGRPSAGTADLVESITLALALAAGVLFGELISAPHRRGARGGSDTMSAGR